MSSRAKSSAMARRAAVAVLLGLVAACEGDGPTTPGGRGFPVDLSLAITLQAEQGGGEAAAFDKATTMHIRLAPEGGAALFEQSAPFDPQAETHIPVSVLVQGETQAVLEVTLLRNTDPLFRGTSSLTLVPNDVAVADLTLVPVAAGISVPSSLAPLTSIGETRPLAGDVLFITGDVAESLHLTWTSLAPGVISVQTDGTTSSVVAVAPGQGQLRATYGVFSSTVQVLVDVTAASVDVTPAASSIDVGASVQLSFTARDGLGNPIAGSTATWSSSDETVATVDQTGRVTGHRAGTATISAQVEEAVGTASVEVVALPPSVNTNPAQAVGVYSASLRASVNPNLTPTTAWFEWGTDPSLASPAETPHVDVGSGSVAQTVSQAMEGLDAATTYYFRADGGQRRGDQHGLDRELHDALPDAAGGTGAVARHHRVDQRHVRGHRGSQRRGDDGVVRVGHGSDDGQVWDDAGAGRGEGRRPGEHPGVRGRARSGWSDLLLPRRGGQRGTGCSAE